MSDSKAMKIMPIARGIRLSRLLLLYTILPVVWAMVYLDKALFDSSIYYALPFRPEVWVVWIYVFGMPHVFASMQTMMDREYLEFYGWRLAGIVLFFLALPATITTITGPMALFIIFTAFIVYHTITQQFGLALAALKTKPGALFFAWKWGAVGVGLVLYSMLYTLPFPIALDYYSDQRNLMVSMSQILLAISLGAGALLLWTNRSNRPGQIYIIANSAMIATEFLLFSYGYYAFMVIVGRFIHEFTAWPIYATHDHNRNLTSKPNFLYRAAGLTRIPVIGLSIILAFALGIAFTYSASVFSVIAPLIVSFSLIHYYTESFMWKRGSIHRRHLAFSW